MEQDNNQEIDTSMSVFLDNGERTIWSYEALVQGTGDAIDLNIEDGQISLMLDDRFSADIRSSIVEAVQHSHADWGRERGYEEGRGYSITSTYTADVPKPIFTVVILVDITKSNLRTLRSLGEAGSKDDQSTGDWCRYYVHPSYGLILHREGIFDDDLQSLIDVLWQDTVEHYDFWLRRVYRRGLKRDYFELHPYSGLVANLVEEGLGRKVVGDHEL